MENIKLSMSMLPKKLLWRVKKHSVMFKMKKFKQINHFKPTNTGI